MSNSERRTNEYEDRCRLWVLIQTNETFSSEGDVVAIVDDELNLFGSVDGEILLFQRGVSEQLLSACIEHVQIRSHVVVQWDLEGEQAWRMNVLKTGASYSIE